MAELSEKLGRAQLTIVADYRGLTVAEMQTLRGQLRPLGTEVRVAKNTLTAIAARQNGQEAIEPALAGPSALIFVYDDMAGSSKAVSDFAQDARRNVSEHTSRLTRQAQSTLETGMNRVLREQPLAVVMAGLAAGAAVAAVFPTTEIEDRTLGPAGESVRRSSAYGAAPGCQVQ